MRLPVRADRGDPAQALPREVLDFGIREGAHAGLTGVRVAAFHEPVLPGGKRRVTTPQQDLARIARAVVDANSYLTLATESLACARILAARAG